MMRLRLFFVLAITSALAACAESSRLPLGGSVGGPCAPALVRYSVPL
jgi:hypothetical protein